MEYVDFPGIAIQGYSGGGVFNSNGQIVGIIQARITGTLSNQPFEVNRAISIEALREMLTNSVKGHSITK